jgi:hypothetical protein
MSLFEQSTKPPSRPIGLEAKISENELKAADQAQPGATPQVPRCRDNSLASSEKQKFVILDLI